MSTITFPPATAIAAPALQLTPGLEQDFRYACLRTIWQDDDDRKHKGRVECFRRHRLTIHEPHPALVREKAAA